MTMAPACRRLRRWRYSTAFVPSARSAKSLHPLGAEIVWVDKALVQTRAVVGDRIADDLAVDNKVYL